MLDNYGLDLRRLDEDLVEEMSSRFLSLRWSVLVLVLWKTIAFCEMDWWLGFSPDQIQNRLESDEFVCMSIWSIPVFLICLISTFTVYYWWLIWLIGTFMVAIFLIVCFEKGFCLHRAYEQDGSFPLRTNGKTQLKPACLYLYLWLLIHLENFECWSQK